MKKLLLLAALVVPNAHADSVSYESAMASVQSISPGVERALRNVLESLHKECGLPLTEENVKYIGQTHPMVSFSLALTILSNQPEFVEKYHQIIASTVSCWDAKEWIEKAKQTLNLKNLIDFSNTMNELMEDNIIDPNSHATKLYAEGHELMLNFITAWTKSQDTKDIELEMAKFIERVKQ
ncbi:TPA: hypothetical protein AB5C39_001836 [Vibrio mimicus]